MDEEEPAAVQEVEQSANDIENVEQEVDLAAEQEETHDDQSAEQEEKLQRAQQVVDEIYAAFEGPENCVQCPRCKVRSP